MGRHRLVLDGHYVVEHPAATHHRPVAQVDATSCRACSSGCDLDVCRCSRLDVPMSHYKYVCGEPECQCPCHLCVHGLTDGHFYDDPDEQEQKPWCIGPALETTPPGDTEGSFHHPAQVFYEGHLTGSHRMSCPTCNGTGYDPHNGGHIFNSQEEYDGTHEHQCVQCPIPCPDCGGSGLITPRGDTNER